jgi:hypothetical protein
MPDRHKPSKSLISITLAYAKKTQVRDSTTYRIDAINNKYDKKITVCFYI